MSIPNLYETEDTPVEEKIIYQRWELPSVGFYWLLSEYDPKQKLAFGYANLNDDQMAEWGYISIKEIEQSGATQVIDWIPTKFKDVIPLEKAKAGIRWTSL